MTTKRVLIMAVVLGVAAASGTAAQEKRAFELRTYFSPPGRPDDLQARFRDHTVKLSEKHGQKMGPSGGDWGPGSAEAVIARSLLRRVTRLRPRISEARY